MPPYISTKTAGWIKNAAFSHTKDTAYIILQNITDHLYLYLFKPFSYYEKNLIIYTHHLIS